MITQRAVGSQLHCIFVDHGMLRKDEGRQVMETYRSLNLNVHFVDASERFLTALAGVTEPERKRKIIGELFIRVFEKEARRLGGSDWLLQGTIYPDVVESGHGGGGVIKSHHNVGGLPDDMKMGLLEPLRDLFKDEVRRVGKVLGIAPHFLGRHPFPGPGLAVRCLGELKKSVSTFCVKRTRYLLKRSAKPDYMIPSGRLSALCCRCAASAWSATCAPTAKRSRCAPYPRWTR